MTVLNLLFTFNTHSLSLTKKIRCINGEFLHVPTLNLAKQNLEISLPQSSAIPPLFSRINTLLLSCELGSASVSSTSHSLLIMPVNTLTCPMLKLKIKNPSGDLMFFCRYCPISLYLSVKHVEHVIIAYYHLFVTSN